MALAQRLLIAGTGGGFDPRSASSFQLTAYGQGGWNQQSDYKAVWFNGNTFVAWVDSVGDVMIGRVPDSTGILVDEFNLHAALQVDVHVSPSILVRSSDNRLVVAYTKHDEAFLYVRISTNPEDTTAWGSEVNLDSTLGGNSYTYPSIFQRTSGTIILFYRDVQDSFLSGVLCYTSSSDGGATWAAQTNLYKNPNKQSYWKVYGDGERIDIAAIDGHPVTDAPTKLYHFWADATDWHDTDGTVITGMPFDPTDLTEVYDGSAGSAWAFNVAMDGGNPVILYKRGTYGDGDEDVTYARWDGAAWDNTVITAEDGPTPVYAAGGAAIDEADPAVAYVCKYDGAQWEMFRYETLDSGVTWPTPEQLTSGSAKPAVWPAAVRDHGSEIKAVWLRGDIAEEAFTLRIEGTNR